MAFSTNFCMCVKFIMGMCFAHTFLSATFQLTCVFHSLWIHIHISLSICLCLSVSLSLSVCLCVWLSLSLCLFIYLYICRYFLFICLSSSLWCAYKKKIPVNKTKTKPKNCLQHQLAVTLTDTFSISSTAIKAIISMEAKRQNWERESETVSMKSTLPFASPACYLFTEFQNLQIVAIFHLW